jgi:FAD/FMN-containing dehydrogenase
MTDTVTPVLGEATVEELRRAIRGELLTPADAAYEEARRVWNGMIDCRPALIARCAGTSDVIAAVGFARSQGLTVAVRGGGHNVAGNATCDAGLVIDLSPMKAARVDADAHAVKAQGGLTWGELDTETQAFGLATTGGLVTTTGIAGFTLGGGIGWLMRKHGLACDNLIAVEVVTADGQTIHASDTDNAELLWGLRGGGGNFGVVTEFEYQLHPSPNRSAGSSPGRHTPPGTCCASGATGCTTHLTSCARWPRSCTRHRRRSCRPRWSAIRSSRSSAST